jgi:phage terminase large subunit
LTAKTKIRNLADFKPFPWQIVPWRDKSPVVLLGGSAGGGKSRLAGEKVHGFCLHYPNSTAVISRKAEDDMEVSTILLMLETVIDIENENRCTWHAKQKRISYENGSEIIFKGIWDDRARESLKSIGKDGAVDIWWMEEGSDFEEEDFNAVIARMRGKAADWTQIIVTTNPSGRLHWINRRLIVGEEAEFYPSSADLNTENPASYLAMLDRLTGIDRLRLRDGLWIDGEGMVVDTWLDDYSKSIPIDSVHGSVTTLADFKPDYGKIFWYMDDGYAGKKDPKTGWFTAKSNPRVALIGQKRKDGLISIIGESYEIETLTDVHIDKLKEFHQNMDWPMPSYIVYDGAAPALGGQLSRAKLNSEGVRVKIDEGLKELRQWIGHDVNGVRKVRVHPRCTMLRFEMGSYNYDKYGNPIDAFNHGIDALRYGVWYEAYGGYGHTEVAHTGEEEDVDMKAIDQKIAEVYAQVEEMYARKHA